MRRLAIYVLYAAVAFRGAIQVGARRDPTLTIALLAAYGLLLFTEPWMARRMGSRSARAVETYRIIYLLLQIALIVVMLLPLRTTDAFLGLFFPLGFQAVEFFGWRAGRWWIVAFLAPMLVYVVLHPDLNNLIMAPIYEAACFLLGTLAHLVQRAETARAENLHMAQELETAQKELQKYASQVEELAGEKARTLLARELHDSVTQTVFSLNLAVQAARLTLPRGPAATSAQFDRVQSLSQGALSDIGRLVSQLGEDGRNPRNLLNDLRQLVSRHQKGGDLVVELHAEGAERDLPPAAAASLCDIVQESLANVKKHADTPQASIRMDLSAVPAWLEVEDCGRGFDLAAALGHPGHLGLAEMSERAREIGWRLIIDSQPGRGTRVRVEEAVEAGE